MSSIHYLRRPRRLAWCLVPAVVIALGAAAPLAAPGISFTMRTTTRTDGGGESPPQLQHVRVQGAVMRFDTDPSMARPGDGLEQGSFVLADMPGKRVVVVMPESRQYMEIKLDDTTSTALMQVMAVPSVVTDLKVSGASLGAGGTVAGMSTRRYKLTTDFKYYTSTGSSAASGMQRKGTMHVEEEYWVSDAMKDVMDPVEQLGRTLGGKGGFGASPFAAMGGSSLADMMQQRYAAQRKLFTGMPLKTVTTTVDVDADGTRKASVSTMQLTNVEKGDLDPALFRVPEGYTKFDFKQFMNVGNQLKDAFKGMGKRKSGDARTAARGESDSTSIADAAKDGAKAGAKEGAKDAANKAAKDAKDAAKKALGGFLKKRP